MTIEGESWVLGGDILVTVNGQNARCRTGFHRDGILFHSGPSLMKDGRKVALIIARVHA